MKYEVINGVFTYADGREQCADTAAGKREYKRRTAAMAERQGDRCAACHFAFDGYLGPPTFEHQDGRTAGHRDERIEIDGKWYNAALHGICNGLIGSRRYEWRDGKYVPKKLKAEEK